MIPKKIHYCWFGRGQLNELAIKCIESWKKFCPDYEIIEWNEDNFDISCNDYVKEAYEAKKWAFVTDYVRLYALYNFGGIYMDTDAELIGCIDNFLSNNAFSGFENDSQISTAIMGSEKGNEWIETLLSYYDNRHFIKSDGSYDMTTNVVTITELTEKSFNFACNGKMQTIDGVFTIYPKDYFCPKSFETGEIEITDNTVCIHHFNASWFTEKDKKNLEEFRSRERRRLRLHEQYGEEKGEKKYRRWEKVRRKYYYLRTYGLLHTIKIIIYKLLGKI